MPRPRIRRRIKSMPDVNYFKPAGIPLANLNEVILTIDEYEAVRLVDFKSVPQKKAGKMMKISQPTLSRLLKSARLKLSDAIINGKAIKIKGGNYKLTTGRGLGKGQGRGLGIGPRGRMSGRGRGPGGVCKCPECGHTEAQIRGQPCMNNKCPKCGTLMIRG